MQTFIEEVTAYNAEVGATSWESNRLVIPVSVIRVACGDVDAGVATLRSASPRGFTMADLLYQAHNGFCRALADEDHAFFEGLELEAEEPPPLYVIRLGS